MKRKTRILVFFAVLLSGILSCETREECEECSGDFQWTTEGLFRCYETQVDCESATGDSCFRCFN